MAVDPPPGSELLPDLVFLAPLRAVTSRPAETANLFGFSGQIRDAVGS